MSVGLPHIALLGKAGSGKDTAAAILRDAAGYQRFALADPLKDVAVSLWGRKARTDRRKLQLLGQYVRAIEEDTWVVRLLGRIEERALYREQDAGPLRIVVTDVRFPNEVQCLLDEGGPDEQPFLTVRLTADRTRRILRLRANGKLQDEADLDDPSETALDDHEADFTVTNDGTELELAEQLVAVLNKVRS